MNRFPCCLLGTVLAFAAHADEPAAGAAPVFDAGLATAGAFRASTVGAASASKFPLLIRS